MINNLVTQHRQTIESHKCINQQILELIKTTTSTTNQETTQTIKLISINKNEISHIILITSMILTEAVTIMI